MTAYPRQAARAALKNRGSHTGNPASLAENPLDAIMTRRLGVDSKQRFRTGEANQEPGPVLEHEFETVNRVHAGNFAAVDLGRLAGGHPLLDRVPLLSSEVDVYSIVKELPHLLLQKLDDLRHRA